MNTVRLCNYIIVFCYFKIVKTFPMNYDGYSRIIVERQNKTMKTILRNDIQTQSTNLRNIGITQNEDITVNISKIRVRRDATGAGKFVEAAQMPQIKLVRLFLQMFKNLWDSAYVGGSHPLHPNLPKVIVKLYKEKIVEFFMPDVGQENRGY